MSESADAKRARDAINAQADHARRFAGLSGTAQRNAVRDRKVRIGKAAGLSFQVIDALSKGLPVQPDAHQRVIKAIQEGWWE